MRDLDGRPVAGATVETWQASADGFYENQRPDEQPEFNLRGIFTTAEDGSFAYSSVKPSGYEIPRDGPVGRLIQALGISARRPAHLHFHVTAPGFETLTTQIFDRLDAALHADPLFGVKTELLADIVHSTCEGGNIQWAVEVPLVLVRARKAAASR